MMFDFENVKSYGLLSDTRMLVLVDCEDFYDMLDEHSPNLLIEYLNMRYNLNIAYLPGKKGGEQ